MYTFYNSMYSYSSCLVNRYKTGNFLVGGSIKAVKVGFGIRGTIGKRTVERLPQQSGPWTYRVRAGKQQVYKYHVIPNPRTDSQQYIRQAFKKAVAGWHGIDQNTKESYYQKHKKKYYISGYYFYISEYMKNFLEQYPNPY